MAKHSYVMMIDDDHSVLSLLSRVFEIEGYGKSSTNARETLSRLEESKPNLVIMDIEAPDFDEGSDNEKLGEPGETPVIILSARCEVASLKNALSSCIGISPPSQSSRSISSGLLSGLKEVKPRDLPAN